MNGYNIEDLIITKYDCLNLGGEWINEIFNFDHVFRAVYNLFFTSLSNWPERMLLTIDTVGIDYQPKPNEN